MKKNKYSVAILLPVYDEGVTVLDVLNELDNIKFISNFNVYIIESNSSDNSRAIIQNWLSRDCSQKNKFQLVLQEKALGKGNAVRLGIKIAKEDIVLIQDADLEYSIGDYVKVLEPLFNDSADFVLGYRNVNDSLIFIRGFGNFGFRSFLFNLAGIFYNLLFNFLYSKSFKDPTTMFKVFKVNCIKNLTFESDRFDFDWELLCKVALNKKLKFVEVPVSYISRSFAEGKKVRIFPDSLIWIYKIVKYRFI